MPVRQTTLFTPTSSSSCTASSSVGACSALPITTAPVEVLHSRLRGRRGRTGSRGRASTRRSASRRSTCRSPTAPHISTQLPCGGSVTSVPSLAVPNSRPALGSRRAAAGEIVCDQSRRSAPRRRRRDRPAVTRSARSLTAGSAFATAAENSQSLRNEWSFSASPTPTTLCGDIPQLAQRRGEARRLVHAGGQHHHGAFVEDHLQLEAEIADGVEHGRANAAPMSPRSRRPTDSGATPRRSSSATNAGGGGVGEHGLSLARGPVEQRAVLGDHESKRSSCGHTRFRSPARGP